MGGVNESRIGCRHRHEYSLFCIFSGTSLGVYLLQEKEQRKEGLAMVGVWVPLGILVISFVLTILLYRHFSKKS